MTIFLDPGAAVAPGGLAAAAPATRFLIVQADADHRAILRRAIERRDRCPRFVPFHLELGKPAALVLERVDCELELVYTTVLGEQTRQRLFGHRTRQTADIQRNHHFLLQKKRTGQREPAGAFSTPIAAFRLE